MRTLTNTCKPDQICLNFFIESKWQQNSWRIPIRKSLSFCHIKLISIKSNILRIVLYIGLVQKNFLQKFRSKIKKILFSFNFCITISSNFISVLMFETTIETNFDDQHKQMNHGQNCSSSDIGTQAQCSSKLGNPVHKGPPCIVCPKFLQTAEFSG